MYSRDEIIFESAYMADLSKINTATNMVCENFWDSMIMSESVEEFYEAGGGIATTISTLIKKLVEQVKKIYDKLNAVIQKKMAETNLKKIGSPELKAAIAEMKSKGVKVIKAPDLKKLYSIEESADKFIDKSMDLLKSKLSEYTKATRKQQKKLAKEIAALCDSLSKKYDAIEKEFKATASAKIDISIDTVYALLNKGKDYITGVTAVKDRMARKLSSFESLISDFKAKYESVDDIDVLHAMVMEADEIDFDDDDDIGMPEPSTYNKVLNSIVSLVRKHSGILNILTGVLATVCTLQAPVSVGVGVAKKKYGMAVGGAAAFAAAQTLHGATSELNKERKIDKKYDRKERDLALKEREQLRKERLARLQNR